MASNTSSMLRATAIVAGLITVLIGVLILLYPGLTLTVLVYLLAFVFIIIGLERIIIGAMG